MSRIARVVAIGYPHHITQRGNYGQAVFVNDADYVNYLKLINIYKKKNELLILAYCIMPNHVHFIAVPSKKNSMSRTLNIGHMCYAQYFNKKNNLRGHLWQGRFSSCVLDEKHLFYAVKYVENNPVRARLTEKAEHWRWSSANAHINHTKTDLDLENISNYLDIKNWNLYISNKDNKVLLEGIRSCTKTGRPFAEEGFINKLQVSLHRSLKKPSMGRPFKNNNIVQNKQRF